MATRRLLQLARIFRATNGTVYSNQRQNFTRRLPSFTPYPQLPFTSPLSTRRLHKTRCTWTNTAKVGGRRHASLARRCANRPWQFVAREE
ncbi:hypothetical protein ACOMHN_031562 [Nucella lapillus]